MITWYKTTCKESVVPDTEMRIYFQNTQGSVIISALDAPNYNCSKTVTNTSVDFNQLAPTMCDIIHYDAVLYGSTQYRSSFEIECTEICKCSLGFRKWTMSCHHGNTTEQSQTLLIYNIDLKALSFEQRLLDEVTSDAFFGFDKLQRLWLHQNRLSALEVDIFSSLVQLKQLFLNFNYIQSLPDGVFNGLFQLQHLFLYSNHISSLSSGVFKALTQLEALYLYDNRLSSLPSDIFRRLVKLKSLQFYQNQFASLRNDTLSELFRLEFFYIHKTIKIGSKTCSTETTLS